MHMHEQQITLSLIKITIGDEAAPIFRVFFIRFFTSLSFLSHCMQQRNLAGAVLAFWQAISAVQYRVAVVVAMEHEEEEDLCYHATNNNIYIYISAKLDTPNCVSLPRLY